MTLSDIKTAVKNDVYMVKADGLAKQKKQQFLDDIASAVQMEHDFTVNQSKIVAAQAWEEGHSNGLYEVITQAQIIADFCETFLRAGHE